MLLYPSEALSGREHFSSKVGYVQNVLDVNEIPSSIKLKAGTAKSSVFSIHTLNEQTTLRNRVSILFIFGTSCIQNRKKEENNIIYQGNIYRPSIFEGNIYRPCIKITITK